MAIKETLGAPKGFIYLIRSIKIVFSDWKVFRLAIMPMLVNILLFVGFFFAFNYFSYEISSRVFEESTQVWYWYALSWLIGVALFIVSIFIVLFGFVVVGLIVAAPFNDMLAAAVEKKVTGTVKETGMSIWGLVKYTVKNEIRKMAVIILVQGSLFLVNFIPGVGQMIFVVVSPAFLALVMAYEFTGYTLDRRGLSFSEKRKYLTSKFGLSMGFGLGVVVTLIIPIVNLLLLPLAVTGGTLLVIENPPETTVDKESK